VVATQYRQLSIPASQRTQSASTTETLTACFLALRELLDPALANAIAYEALSGEVHDEAHAIELMVRAIVKRIPRTIS
jgi:hypothetical protein